MGSYINYFQIINVIKRQFPLSDLNQKFTTKKKLKALNLDEYHTQASYLKQNFKTKHFYKLNLEPRGMNEKYRISSNH